MTDPGANTWSDADLGAVEHAQEVRVRTRRRDGSLRNPRIIWTVRVGDRVVVRSANGRGAQWFGWAIATGVGQLLVEGRSHDVTFTEVRDEATLTAVDEAYQAKYGDRYASIVASLNGPGPRDATLLVVPRDL